MNTQGDLFSQPRPAAAPDRPTSVAAAESMRSRAAALRERVRQHIETRGPLGATCDEIELALDLSHQTASPRVNELFRASAIADSGYRRPTRSGRRAIVWVLPLFRGDEPPCP
jgi:hypothetical protein